MDVISPTGVMTNGRMNLVMLRAFLGVWSDGGIQIRCRGEGPARNSARPRPRPGSLRRERPIRLNRTHWEGGRRFSIPFADSPDEEPRERGIIAYDFSLDTSVPLAWRRNPGGRIFDGINGCSSS